MRILHLALVAALLAPATASAQSTAQQMLDMAKSIRASAEKLKDSVTPTAKAAVARFGPK